MKKLFHIAWMLAFGFMFGLTVNSVGQPMPKLPYENYTWRLPIGMAIFAVGFSLLAYSAGRCDGGTNEHYNT